MLKIVAYSNLQLCMRRPWSRTKMGSSTNSGDQISRMFKPSNLPHSQENSKYLNILYSRWKTCLSKVLNIFTHIQRYDNDFNNSLPKLKYSLRANLKHLLFQVTPHKNKPHMLKSEEMHHEPPLREVNCPGNILLDTIRGHTVKSSGNNKSRNSQTKMRLYVSPSHYRYHSKLLDRFWRKLLYKSTITELCLNAKG